MHTITPARFARYRGQLDQAEYGLGADDVYGLVFMDSPRMIAVRTGRVTGVRAHHAKAGRDVRIEDP